MTYCEQSNYFIKRYYSEDKKHRRCRIQTRERERERGEREREKERETYTTKEGDIRQKISRHYYNILHIFQVPCAVLSVPYT